MYNSYPLAIEKLGGFDATSCQSLSVFNHPGNTSLIQYMQLIDHHIFLHWEKSSFLYLP